ncbi:NAD-dependent epimerase/dehydratase family protein [Micromonospora sp. NBC_01655]|uniref:NAD-dependent epimerase/dehydratase family protein n=1 Tax=Micromonospora sp. NBC_01655 TaxID=2975983 RepID=UPI00225689C5|nr:NAD-dependent epimerase/dehydratase family protein [Micromonospora sp. NBC_01655]MCX4473212.1 NAD-dependent epimerase/dehydratase family protein [Micromonospora sp. NBC_01655]
MSAERVVVTGASGMLGSHLVRRLLDTGHRVHGVDLLPAVHTHPDLTHSQGDIRDGALLDRVLADSAAVVHCAAALPSYPAEMIRSIIVDGTRAVLDAARRVEVPRVVHISSTAVYGLPRLVPTPEEHPRVPVDPYTRAKVEAELLVERHRADGLCVPVLRPKTFLGPGRMGLFAMLFEWAEEGRNFPVLGRGDVRVQMFAVEDLVDAVLIVLTAPDDVAGDTYNLGAAEFGTLREDFQAVLDAAGRGGRVVGLPAGPALAALAALERSGLSPVYGRLLHKLRADSYVSIDKARERLGFKPRFANRDAILGTYRWWRENRHATAAGGGRTSREPWRQGALSLAKIFF